jgi:hypothetical protein
VIAGAYRQFIFFFSPDPVSGGLRRELIEPVLRPTPHQPCPLFARAIASCVYGKNGHWSNMLHWFWFGRSSLGKMSEWFWKSTRFLPV